MKQRLLALATASALASLLVGCATKASAPVAGADSIYLGGSILTMNDAQPSAEAVAVRAGRITAVGSRAELMKLQGALTRVVDCRARR